MAERYQQSWAAFDVSQEYPPSFVQPASWLVTLDVCPARGRTHQWTVTQGSKVVKTATTTACVLAVPIPALGRAVADVTVTDTGGHRKTYQARMDLVDLLVVGLGDSSASGEGNPDADQVVSYDGTTATVEQPARWHDNACHRSERSGIARAASRLEAGDPHSSVTFLSFACTGATTADVITRQIPQLRQALCASPTCSPDDRMIDAIVMMVGANDVGFASVVKGCLYKEHGDVVTGDDACPSDAAFERRIAELAAPSTSSSGSRGYASLASALTSELGDRVGTVLVSDYPEVLFGNDDGHPETCGVFDNAFVVPVLGGLVDSLLEGAGIDVDILSITEGEASTMARWGAMLNDTLEQAAAMHGWVFAGGVAGAFRTHGYCSSDRYLVSFSESVSRQGNMMGTLHPNALGHERIAANVWPALLRTTPVFTYAITIEQATVIDRSPPAAKDLSDAAYQFGFTLRAAGSILDTSDDFVISLPADLSRLQTLKPMRTLTVQLRPVAGQQIYVAAGVNDANALTEAEEPGIPGDDGRPGSPGGAIGDVSGGAAIPTPLPDGTGTRDVPRTKAAGAVHGFEHGNVFGRTTHTLTAESRGLTIEVHYSIQSPLPPFAPTPFPIDDRPYIPEHGTTASPVALATQAPTGRN